MFDLNKKIKKLTPYDPSMGNYDIRLDANESFIDPGKIFEESMGEILKGIPFNRYPDPTCSELRKAFGKTYDVDEALVVAGNGSDELITVILGAFLESGNSVATLVPDFSMYGFYGDIYERQKITFEKKADLTIDVDTLISDLQKTKPDALIFSNPCSPTSQVLSKEELKKIVKSTDALVILDEAYMEFSHGSLLKEVTKYDNLIILKTCSKAWGLAAVRLGFAVSNEKITGALNTIRSPYNVNSFTQAVGTLVLSHPTYIQDAKKKIINSRNELYNDLLLLENNPIIIDGKNKTVQADKVIRPETNFVLIEFKNIEDAKNVYEYLLERSIIVRRLEKFLRITAGNHKENQALIDALT